MYLSLRNVACGIRFMNMEAFLAKEAVFAPSSRPLFWLRFSTSPVRSGSPALCKVAISTEYTLNPLGWRATFPAYCHRQVWKFYLLLQRFLETQPENSWGCAFTISQISSEMHPEMGEERLTSQWRWPGNLGVPITDLLPHHPDSHPPHSHLGPDTVAWYQVGKDKAFSWFHLWWISFLQSQIPLSRTNAKWV